MNEAQIVNIVTKAVESSSSNNQWVGFVILGGLYVIKTLWMALQAKQKDQNSVENKELTRMTIENIEGRQIGIMRDIKGIRESIKHIETEIDYIKGN